MKKLLFLLFVPAIAFSQRNAVYAEVTTQVATSSISINYERQLFQNSNLYLRAGVGIYAHAVLGGGSVNSIPIILNYLIPVSERNYFDLGIGPNWIGPAFESSGSKTYIPYLFANLGFRRNTKKNMFWRIHATPYAVNLRSNESTTGGEIFDFPKTWLGFSIGKRF